MHLMHAFDRRTVLFGRLESVGRVDALDDDDAVFILDLAADLARQLSARGIDVTRLQRASEGAE